MTIIAAADGSALGNPGPAGWAWYVDDDTWQAGGWPHGTNNQGELMAVLDLLRATAHLPEEPLKILCDSQYVIKCITAWMPGWKRKGWRKADGKPVLNIELLKELDAALAGRRYEFEWVKGHAGHELNEAADARARGAATAYQKGQQPPVGPGFPGRPQLRNAEALKNAESLSVKPSEPEDPQTQLDLFSSLEEDLFEPASVSPAEAVIALERQLLDPAIRADASRVAVLLHPDFEEIGASGRLWSRDALIATMAEDFVAPLIDQLNAAVLTEDAILLTYRSLGMNGAALRSSLWLRHQGQWRLRFHQGTPEA
ncbi:ribonuclease HI family protein [Psychromicrobium xiongbiense]|uniref:ribonuclease HI family protein n=1 Tax=Psychromicrobium xiongbiense TaxID=3051184 RepID=UPI0025555883|nr:ribonuclease HI family protein [Psychromicrobium sp. YIM S02556]